MLFFLTLTSHVTHTGTLEESCFLLASHRVNRFLNIAQPVSAHYVVSINDNDFLEL